MTVQIQVPSTEEAGTTATARGEELLWTVRLDREPTDLWSIDASRVRPALWHPLHPAPESRGGPNEQTPRDSRSPPRFAEHDRRSVCAKQRPRRLMLGVS